MQVKKMSYLSILSVFICSSANGDIGHIPFGNPFVECAEVLNGFVPCKEVVPIEREVKKKYFSSEEFNWRCNISILEFDFFNSTQHTINRVVIEGTTHGTRVSERVSVYPGESEHVFSLGGSSFCQKEKKARLYFEYTVKTGGECLKRYSIKEVKKEMELCKKEVESQKSEQVIYNNCVVSKSKGVDKYAMHNVRTVCKAISENPSALQRWRWGQ